MFIQSKGIIIKNRFEKDGKEIFKEVFDDFEKQLNTPNSTDERVILWKKLNSLSVKFSKKSKVTGKQCQNFYYTWEKFHNALFGNEQTISILMTSVDNKYQLEGYYAENEGKVLKGARNKSKTLNDGSVKYYKQVQTISNANVSKALRRHLQDFWTSELATHFSNMLKSVDSEIPTIEEVKYVYANQDELAPFQRDQAKEGGGMQHRRMEALNRDYNHYRHRYPYRRLVATQGDVTTYGRWQEAFFNHLVKLHGKKIDFSSFEKFDTIDWNFNTRALIEERNEWDGGLYARGLEANDNERFTSGGDFVMVDADGKVLMNTQLKMGRNTLQGNAISMDVICKYINQIGAIITSENESIDKEDAIDKFYRDQQTTAWIKDNEEESQKTLSELVNIININKL